MEAFVIKGRGLILVASEFEMGEMKPEVGDRIAFQGKVSGIECSSSNTDKGYVVQQLAPFHGDTVETMEKKVDEIARRCHVMSIRTHRLTRLIRKALPEEAHVGSGLEGMIESLLAFALKTNYPGVEEPSKEEKAATLSEDVCHPRADVQAARKEMGIDDA